MNEKELAGGMAATPGYRYADVVGNRLYLAGQVPLLADGRLVGPHDVTSQTVQCLANLFTLVSANGFDRDDIHQLTIYVIGPHQHLIDAWKAVTEGFDNNVPPATLLGVTVLGYTDQLVEIDAQVEGSSDKSGR
jgi:enamine deaminase RidA (YjgF/YER057c/UK114 family)